MRLIVKAIFEDQGVFKYRIKETSLLQKVFNAISESSNIPLDLLRFTYKNQSLKGTDTILSTNMNEDNDRTIHVRRTDSSSSDASDASVIEISQEPIDETNDTVTVDYTIENQSSTIVIDDVIAQQPEDVLNQIETPPTVLLPKEKENIAVDSIKENKCANENPLKRKFDEKSEGSLSKVCKVEPLKNFQANNMLISNLVADVNQKKMAAEESLKKIPELEAEVMNMDAADVTHANDLNTLVECHRLEIEALKQLNQNEITHLKEAHRKVLDEVIEEKNSFVDNQSQTIDLMKQTMIAKFDKDLEKVKQKNKDEIENLKVEHRKQINDKEESHRKSLVELTKNNNLVLQKIMAEKFQVIDSQNQNFESVKTAFAEEKQRMINERKSIEKAHDEELNSLKRKRDDAITEAQTNQLKHDTFVNELKTTFNKERQLYCDEISQLKDAIEELKESHQEEIVGLKEANLKVLAASKTDHTENVGPENLETINQLKKQLSAKSKFHSENIQNIIKKCDVKRMKDISGLKSQLENQAEAHAIELKCLADQIEILKKNCTEIECLKSQLDAERAESNRKFEKSSKESDKLHEYAVNQLNKKHEAIVQELQQKLNEKSVECEETMKNLNQQKTSFETELKTSKENHIRTITKLQSDIKKTKELNGKGDEELKKVKNRLVEFEKKTNELQNERMKLVNELNHLQMNSEQSGKEQAILTEIEPLKRAEHSHKYLSEQYSILHNENNNLKSSHQQLDQLLTDKTKAFEEFQAFHKKRIEQLEAERDGNMTNLNDKTVEIKKLKDMRRVEEDVRNAAHQNEILNLIGQHREELESLRSEMQRKTKESSGSQRIQTPTEAALALRNESSSNDHIGGEKSTLSPMMVSSTQPKSEPKVRKCDQCGNKARYVASYSYCSPMCNMAYCLKKTNREIITQQQMQLPKQPQP